MTAQYRSSNQPNHTHKNLSTSGNSSSPSCTPFFKHAFTYATVRHATTNTLTRLCCSSHETATASTQTCATHTPYDKIGKQSLSSNGSNGQGHGQASQLQAANEQPKIQKAWSLSAANKFGQLANGIWGCIKNPTNTIEFIFQHEVPADHMKYVTYGQFVCLVRPKKAEANRMQFMVGGDNQLPRQSSHPNCRNAGGHNAIQ